MKVLGIITEYNPFHNGHLYHLNESKKITNATHTVCIMSGNFIQRGEPAIINKWARTKSALLNGVDLVIELPTAYAVSSAENFAFGSIKILDSLKFIDCISFGSESGNIENLKLISKILNEEPKEFKMILKKNLNKGLSFPKSREIAIIRYLNSLNIVTSKISNILNSSNNILGIEYLKALLKLDSNITPYTIPRINNKYNDISLSGTISSATAIRTHLKSNSLLDENCFNLLKDSLPSKSLDILIEEINNGRGPIFLDTFNDIIIARLREMSSSQILDLPYINEGLNNSIKECSRKYSNIYNIIKDLSSKRYSTTRIQRILLHTLTGLRDYHLHEFNSFGGPSYARILGFNSKGVELLNRIKKNTNFSLISKASKIYKTSDILSKNIFAIDNNSTDIYVLGYTNDTFKCAGQEFTQKIIKF